MFLRSCVMRSIGSCREICPTHGGLSDTSGSLTLGLEERPHRGRPDMSRCGRRRSVDGVRSEHHEERLVAGCSRAPCAHRCGRAHRSSRRRSRDRASSPSHPSDAAGSRSTPIGLGEGVPRGGSPPHVSGRRAVVAVQVLADQNGAVARVLQPHRQGAVLEAGLVEDGPPACMRDVIAATVRPHARRMREQAGEEGGPRRATHRRRDHAVRISRAALEDLLADRIHPVDGAIPLVVGDDEEHVRHACPSPSETDGHLPHR